jgi:hypothetical protein
MSATAIRVMWHSVIRQTAFILRAKKRTPLIAQPVLLTALATLSIRFAIVIQVMSKPLTQQAE